MTYHFASFDAPAICGATQQGKPTDPQCPKCLDLTRRYLAKMYLDADASEFEKIINRITNVHNLKTLLDPPDRKPSAEQRVLIEARIQELEAT